MTTGKTIALARWTFVGQVISLGFNMLSKVVITFLPRSKHLLISWLQSLSSATLEPPKINSVSIASSSICHEVMGPDAMIFQFSSVAQLCLTLCDPMNHSMPGLPVHRQLLEFTQTHVHRVSDERESEGTPGVGDGQGGLACCDSWGHRVGHD